MSTHRELEREVELTRQQLSDTVDELVHKMDIRERTRPLIQNLRYYRVPIALFALSLIMAVWSKKKA
jgi:hypothetical protein